MTVRHDCFASFLLVVCLCGLPFVASAADAGRDVCTADDTRAECRDDATPTIMDYLQKDEREEEDCEDGDSDCKGWAEMGECEINPDYMLEFCRKSCKVCKIHHDPTDYGEPQIIMPHIENEVKAIISKSDEYMKQISNDPKYSSVIEACRNTDARCSEWAVDDIGCEDNPKYMKQHCSPACQSCDYVLEMKQKCAHDPDGKDAIEVGGMDGLFERMVRIASDSNWQPTILSRPQKKPETNEDGTYAPLLPCEDDITNPCNVPSGPWVITLEKFITPLEKQRLLEWGTNAGYKRSKAGDMVIEARTSAHAWCRDDCWDDPIVKGLRDRIVEVTGIPEQNHESLQLLKYEPGQYYLPHNDFIEAHTTQSHGPRLLTFFMYFNEVEEGGGTRFPKLNGLTVEPKEGRVLIWPSAMDDDLMKDDRRTDHEAMEVTKGEKFAANAWIHTRDFQTGFTAGCPS